MLAIIPLVAALGCGGGTTRSRGAPPTGADAAVEVGLATYYSSHLAGRRTASGERYDPKAFTAAHRKLPFGALVRVVRLDPGPSRTDGGVVVRINDRGPYGQGRVIDLSLAAARQLGMLRAGVVRVRVELVALPWAGVRDPSARPSTSR